MENYWGNLKQTNKQKNNKQLTVKIRDNKKVFRRKLEDKFQLNNTRDVSTDFKQKDQKDGRANETEHIFPSHVNRLPPESRILLSLNRRFPTHRPVALTPHIKVLERLLFPRPTAVCRHGVGDARHHHIPSTNPESSGQSRQHCEDHVLQFIQYI